MGDKNKGFLTINLGILGYVAPSSIGGLYIVEKYPSHEYARQQRKEKLEEMAQHYGYSSISALLCAIADKELLLSPGLKPQKHKVKMERKRRKKK